MMENFDHILLFKTDIKTDADKSVLKPLLDLQDGIDEWNVDLEDEDYVLRIISYTLTPACITELIKHEGYNCHEL